MYVLPEYRGLGIICEIIDALSNWSLERGVTELKLDVYYHNAAAIRAYEKAGFIKNMTEMMKEIKQEL